MNKSERMSEIRKGIDKFLFTVKEVAALTGYGEVFIRKQVKLGELDPWYPLGENNYKISCWAILRWIEKGEERGRNNSQYKIIKAA